MVWERGPTHQLFAAATSVLVWEHGGCPQSPCKQSHLLSRKDKGLAGPRVSHQPSPLPPALWVVGRVCSGSPGVGWPSGWLLGGQSFNPHPHPNAAMEPQHTVCGPGSGKRCRGKGLGGEEKATPHDPRMIPDSCYGLKLSSDPHCDFAIPLERFV